MAQGDGKKKEGEEMIWRIFYRLAALCSCWWYRLYSPMPKRVLDLGCGSGDMGKWFQRHGAEVTFCDIVPNQFVDVVVADAHALPFKDCEFDLVIHGNLLEHLHSPLVALAEARRVSKRMLLYWTPWHSPWGKHRNQLVIGKELFVTTVKGTMRQLEQVGWKLRKRTCRYWPMLPWLSGRETASWNVQCICE